MPSLRRFAALAAFLACHGAACRRGRRGTARHDRLRLGPDRSHVGQRAGPGRARAEPRRAARRRCLPAAERAELRVQRHARPHGARRRQRLAHLTRTGRGDRRRLQRPAFVVRLRRRAHARHAAQRRRPAHPVGEPPRDPAGVRTEERRARSSRAAPPRAPRSRLERLLVEPPRVVPDRLHPSRSRRAASRSRRSSTRRSSTRSHLRPRLRSRRSRSPSGRRSSSRASARSSDASAPGSIAGSRRPAASGRCAGSRPGARSVRPSCTCSRTESCADARAGPGTHWLNLEVVDAKGSTAHVTIRFTVRPRHR